MITEHIKFITAALESVNISERFIKRQQRNREEYPTGIAAYLFFLRGSLKRDGSKIRYDGMPAGQTVRQWFHGSGVIRLELFMTDDAELEASLAGILEYFHTHSLRNTAGVPLKFPNGDITLSFQDEEGIMLNRFAMALDFPVELGAFDNTVWKPYTVDVTGSLELVQQI